MSYSEKQGSKIGTGIYEETILSKWMTLILGTTAIIFLFIWIYEIFVGWNWTNHLTSWF